MARKVTHVPSFDGLQAASDAASRAKKANLKQDSRHELLLRRELRKLGLRYRKYFAGLPGNPDLGFFKAKVIVFCDGDFWHGRNWPQLKRELSRRHNAPYWIAKIARNRQRDREITQTLVNAGWDVLRFWETAILRDPNKVARVVHARVESRLATQESLRGMAERKRPLA